MVRRFDWNKERKKQAARDIEEQLGRVRRMTAERGLELHPNKWRRGRNWTLVNAKRGDVVASLTDLNEAEAFLKRVLPPSRYPS